MRFATLILVAGTAASLTSCGKLNHMQDQTDHMAATTDHMSVTTDGMAKTTEGMSKTTNDMAKTTNHMSETTDDMATTTKKMAVTTEQMADITNHMSETTDGMSETTVKMSETTNHMSETTDKMATTTEKMSVTTDHMNETTCTMYASLRQGNTKLSRDTDMKAIRDAKNITEKLELAAKYMQGFEYQVWSPVCVSIASRETVIEQAATELLTAIQPLIHDREKVGATQTSSDAESLYAIAATLHRTNPLQESLLKGTNEKPMTLEEILVQGIALDKKKNAGQLASAAYPTWAGIVGKYEKDAEFILRLRANFLMGYAYAVADSDDFGNAPGTMKKAKRVFETTTIVGGWFGAKWTPNLSKRSITEIRERIVVSLEMSAATRASLKALGIDPMVDQTMVKIWKNADFTKYTNQSAKLKKPTSAEQLQIDTLKALVAARDKVIQK